MTFYADIADFYNDMISFDKRLQTEYPVYQNLLKKFPAQKILDAGCGSGYHSLVLNKAGADVTGFDPESKLLDMAYKRVSNQNIRFFMADFLNFKEQTRHKFDAVFSLGNSFVHLLSENEMLKTLKLFRSVLNPGGYVCIGIVNYDKIVAKQQTTISKKEKNGKIYHRYYSFEKDLINFHVDVHDQIRKHQYQTKLFPLTSSALNSLSETAGFSRLKIYGSMKFEPYNPMKSDNICAFLFF